MSNNRIRNACQASGLSLLSALLLAGCRGSSFVEGGPEIRYLTSKSPVIKIEKIKSKTLLPLAVGTRWEMQQIGVPPERAAAINAQVTKRDSEGTVVEFRKNGQLWRREVYRDTPSGLFLTAMAEDDKPMMRLSPPVPIILYPIKEGNEKAWIGSFRYGKVSFPANGYSRISALEKVAGPTGKNLAYRTDTLISINQDGNIIKFPTLRWLAPGTGFVRRSFVEQGRPIYVQLRKFTAG